MDIFRHSYGSYHYAAFGNLTALRANMGHTTIQTYFDYSHHALTKKEALPYWQIGPGGTEVAITREVA